MRNNKSLFILALLCAAAQGAWADEVTTQYANGVFTGFTATSGTGDNYQNLVDGNNGSEMLCTHGDPSVVEFHSSGYLVPTGYIMTTSPTPYNSWRYPKSWTVKAKVNENDVEWTTLATETNISTVANSRTSYEFAITGNTTAYKYFRLEVSEVNKEGSLFELAEFRFKGTTMDIDYATVGSVNSIYDLSTNPSITPVVNIGDNALTLGTHYTAALNGQNVASYPISITQQGDNTLTFTGMGSYRGTKSLSFYGRRELNGSGTSESPYTIGSTADWNLFVGNIAQGSTYSEKFVRLNQNISVSTMVGTSEANSFQGTFLGGGHTLTFTKGSAEAAFDEDYCAPFRYTKDATIRDLNVAGDIYTSKKFAAGIVARPNGTTNITNCHVSTVIHSSVSADGGDGTHGGFTAFPQGNVNFTGCVYTGRMFTTTGSTKCGGFVGWHNNQTYTFVNSLYAPDPNITAAANETAITTDCATFVRGGSAGTGCYYTETMGEAQGTPAYTSAPADEVSKPVTVNATTYYMPCTVSGVKSNYLYTGTAITVTPTVTYNGEALTDGTDYTVSTSPATVQEKGNYTLTVTGTGSNFGSKTVGFAVLAPYTIGTTDEWNDFVASVASGTSYSDLFVMLTNDINVTQKVGTVSGTTQQNAFSGTFDGCGHTITADITDDSNQGTALFCYINGATIKNLAVAGTIVSSQYHAAGLVGFSKGTNSIENCKVAVNVNGGQYVGGIVGHALNGNISISDCVYSGLMTGGANFKGALIGWGDSGNRTVTNCLYLMADGQDTSNLDLVMNGGDLPTCYKTTEAGTQGIRVYAEISDNAITTSTSQQLADGNSYYLACRAGGIEELYALNDGDVSVSPTVTSAYGENLTFGTDFTATLNGTEVSSMPITISQQGNYTLTLTGKGDYRGSTSLEFIAYGDLSGSGTAVSPYLINHKGDWIEFTKQVASGTTYDGQYVKLTADIGSAESPVSQTVGTVSGSTQVNPFSGTFLGDGHTIIITTTDNSNQGTAPFRYINGATIKDLTVGGTISSNQPHASGLVGFASGTNTIDNCIVNTTVVIGCDYAGGIVGHGLSSNTTIKDCVFAGTIRSTHVYEHRYVVDLTQETPFFGSSDYRCSYNIGSIWGWSTSGTPIIEGCLEKGTYIDIWSMHPIGLQGGSGTVSDCYYVTPQQHQPTNACSLGAASQVYADIPDNWIMKQLQLRNDVCYIPITVNFNDTYDYTGSDIAITPVLTESDSTPLTAGTDYTFSPSIVKDMGSYTLVITGIGSCVGTKTIPFIVTDHTIKGKFTVNASGAQVRFSEGNLRATTSDLGENWTWSFAKNQWDYVGDNAANNKVNGAGTVSENGTVDLFCWVGASSSYIDAAQYGITNSDEEDTQLGLSSRDLKSDWGNTIGQGFRTLSAKEWDYLLNTRQSRTTVNGLQNARYTQAKVNDVKGVILFPDDVTISANMAKSWGLINGSSEWNTVCTAEQWTALEAKGCVFLPAAGCRYIYNGSMKVSNAGERGFYWSTTRYTDKANALTMLSDMCHMEKNTSRWQAASVRLVKDFVMTYEGDYTITDGDTYTIDEDRGAATATYTKTTDRVGKFHSWLVPFDYTLNAGDLEKFTFYKIYMIANAIAPDATPTNDIWIYVKPMQEGDVLHANMPYLYKPLEAVNDYEFTTNFATLKAKAEGAVATMQTMEDTYTLYATYTPTTATAQDPFYYMNTSGSLSLGNNGTVTVGAFRWIMRVESKFGGNTTASYAPRRIFIYHGEGNMTGVMGVIDESGDQEQAYDDNYWYSLDGHRFSEEPSQAGVYIHKGIKWVIK